jgi:flagellar basal-body rod modification protein FlgD
MSTVPATAAPYPSLGGLNGAGTAPGTGSTTPAGSTGTTTSGTDPTQQIGTDYNTFLTILTTELQNQDPTQPLDTNQFTSQLVQFSQLEQSLTTNQKLQTLIDGQSNGALGTALGYLGHSVEATGNSFVLDGSNPASLTYSLPSTASNAVINVMNASGSTVQQIKADPSGGQHTVSFDGSGLPAGQYTFSVTAVDSTGAALNATTYTTGKVTGVETANGKTTLNLGPLSVDAAKVTQVTA